MSDKNRLITQEEFNTAIKWAMVEVVCNHPEYKRGLFSKEIENLADNMPKEEQECKCRHTM